MKSTEVKAFGAKTEKSDLEQLQINRRETLAEDVEIDILYCGEELEIEMDLKSHPVRAAKEFHHQNDLPDHRDPRAGGARDEGRELRQHHVAQAARQRHAVDLRHGVEPRVERPRALADHCGDIGDLVERDGDDGGGLVEADPEIAQHDQHQRRQVEEDHQPGIEPAVELRKAPHGHAKRNARAHRQGKGPGHAAQRASQVIEQLARAQRLGKGRRQRPGLRQDLRIIGEMSGKHPEQHEHGQRNRRDAEPCRFGPRAAARIACRSAHAPANEARRGVTALHEVLPLQPERVAPESRRVNCSLGSGSSRPPRMVEIHQRRNSLTNGSRSADGPPGRSRGHASRSPVPSSRHFQWDTV